MKDRVAFLSVPDANQMELDQLAHGITKAIAALTDDLGFHLIVMNKEFHTISKADFEVLVERFCSELGGKMSSCLCLKCRWKFDCDFSLSTWAAKARMARFPKNIKLSFITTKCSDFIEKGEDDE